MGGDALHILIVEDSADDALLLLGELKRKGQLPKYQRVDSEAEFVAALEKNSWDAVISDYVLPNFSGPEALRLLRERGLDTPFIMVSGIYGEEEAVRMMKAGASDYVMKANLSRLAPALEREVLAAHDRRRRRRAEGATQFLAALVESSADAIYGKNLEGVIVSWNPAAEQMFGHSAEEIIGRSAGSLYPKHREKELSEILECVRRGEVVAERETERLHKNGSVIPVAVTVSPVRNGGEIMGASAIARDISRQKRVEQERQQLMQNLVAASKQVKTLTGLLPICAACKRVRDDKGYWQQVEAYLAQHSDLTFSHSICPACAAEYERQFELKNKC
jgi:PAS domain S-box-containing protein